MLRLFKKKIKMVEVVFLYGFREGKTISMSEEEAAVLYRYQMVEFQRNLDLKRDWR